MLNLGISFKRWRHSKGYGVHSPYAFNFVNDVLRPGRYGLYSYLELDDHLRPEERFNISFSNLVKFTLRLTVFLETKRIISLGPSRLSELVAKCLKIPYVVFSGKEPLGFIKGDLLIIEDSDNDKERVRQAIEDYKIPVFAINPDINSRRILETPISRGLLLNGKHRMILIPRKEMAYTAYDMALNISPHSL